MTRTQLEHIIRAAADIADDDELIIIGSQSILAQHPNPPAACAVSVEADVYPKNKPEHADLIDGCIGEGSPFHDTYGYDAQGVGERTAVLPDGWQARLVPICNAGTRGATGWCLDLHDMLIAKLVAGRDKDFRFAATVAEERLACGVRLRARLQATRGLAATLRARVEARIGRIFAVRECPKS